MNILEIFKQLIESSGFMALTWQQAVMIGVSFIFLFLAIVKKFEPLLLLPIAFGMLLANLPEAGLMQPGPTLLESGVLYIIYQGVKSSVFPCLIFLGVGAMTDFGPLLANPSSLLLGGAAQLGIYVAFVISIAPACLRLHRRPQSALSAERTALRPFSSPPGSPLNCLAQLRLPPIPTWRSSR